MSQTRFKVHVRYHGINIVHEGYIDEDYDINTEDIYVDGKSIIQDCIITDDDSDYLDQITSNEITRLINEGERLL